MTTPLRQVVHGWIRDIAQSAIAAGLLFVVGVGVYWWLDNAPVVRLIGEPTMLTPRVKAGTPATVHWRGLKLRDCPGTVERAIVNGVTHQLPQGAPTQRVGDVDFVAWFHVPDTLPPGEYAYRVTLRYQCNPLRLITQVMPDVPFTIVP